jgi:hypothetical protein
MWEFGLDEPQISALSETGEGKMFEEWFVAAIDTQIRIFGHLVQRDNPGRLRHDDKSLA